MSSTPPAVTSGTLSALRSTLLNIPGSLPLAHRFRALFTLKSFGKSTAVLEDDQNAPVSDAAIHIIAEGFSDPSALLKHELAYVLGQMGNLHAVPVLEHVLSDTQQNAMVRHEAAEALGALSSRSSEPVLKRYLNDEERCVRETCEIALARIEWAKSEEQDKQTDTNGTDPHIGQFTSVDPAPPAPLPSSSKASTSQIKMLQSTLTSPTFPLFERYRAMFALRNIAGLRESDTERAAVEALAAGFTDDSELFKHEIAFVFGQLSNPYSIPALLRVLRDDTESSMVRHEAAEALGGIVDPGSEPIDVLKVLKEWSERQDAPQVVRESCVVAVDMWEYENSNEFQYANGLQQLGVATESETAAAPVTVGG
ncbi:Deoxyhypusine hydroxylase [Hysterangium stoloniferum]|nr:Deoxyhypusine hydroxylase [Hysterangium stoloniferum]